MILEGVKCTFFNYPFKIPATIQWENLVRMPTLLNLAAMKAYTLGRRNSWKDYTDLYFMLKAGVSLKDIVTRANELYREQFSEKLFRQQLCFFKDLNPTEKIDFIIPSPPTQKEIKTFLIDQAIS